MSQLTEMSRHRGYVGANETGQVETEKVFATLSDAGLPGATIYPATGLWEGQTEKSVVVEVLGELPNKLDGRELARSLAVRLNQQCVLYTRDTVDVAFISGAEA